MRLKLLPSILFIVVLAFSSTLKSQEVSKVRTTKYVFDLNAIKHQTQVDGVTNQTKEIENVESCNLNWLEYKMEVVVKEGGDFGNFPMETLKAILIEHKVDLQNFTKETISQ